jgi:VWFA-related protein
MRKIMIGIAVSIVCYQITSRASPSGTAGTAQAAPGRTVYVSVTERDGAPVTDLTAADFELKIGGRTREIVAAELTKAPIRLAMIVADGGTGAFQYTAATLVQNLQSVAEFKLVSVIEQPERIVDYTSDLDAVVAGLKRIGTRSGRPTSGQVLEAIAETLNDIRRDGKRSVIVVMRLGGAASSHLRADNVREGLRKTGSVLYVISPPGGGVGGGAAAGGGGSGNMGAARTDYAASESAGRGRDLEVVLNDGSKESGGRYEEVAGTALNKAVEQISRELLNQYQLTYVAPEGGKANEKLEVSSRRRGLKVNAPSRPAS